MHFGSTKKCLPEDNICWKRHRHNCVICLSKAACTTKEVHNGAIVLHIWRNQHGIENPLPIIDKPSMVAPTQYGKVSYLIRLNPSRHFIKQPQSISPVPMHRKSLYCGIVGHKCAVF
uniref:Uncharacterized protein n=1 Tax=Arundo donax TaxID=35708 RepID=A0A0A9D113_ARUDO